MRLTKRELESLNKTFARAQKVCGTAFHLSFVPDEPGEDDENTVYAVRRHPTRGEHDAMSFEVGVFPGWREADRKTRYVLAGHEILHALLMPLAELIGVAREGMDKDSVRALGGEAEKREETLVYQLQRALFGDVS